jgi:uncharacterized protein (UPF0333 family)
MLLKKRGQGVLEYVVVLTAIVTAVIVGAALIARKDTSAGLGKVMNDATERIQDATKQLPGVTR